MKLLGMSSRAGGLLAVATMLWLPGLAAGAAPAGGPETKPAAASQFKPVTGPALRTAVREALTAARKQPQPDAAGVRKLSELYRTLQVDTSLAHTQREALRLAVRARLKTWATRLERGAAEPLGRPQTSGQQQALAQQAVLAQQAPPGAGQQPAATQPPIDHSQELLEVIQDTIMPDTWDARGGLGVIRYWPPGHALIVRQTSEVHEQLGRLLGDLRQ